MQGARVDPVCNAVEIDQKTQEYLVGGRAVFVYSAEVAHDCNARNILAMERKYTGRLSA